MEEDFPGTESTTDQTSASETIRTRVLSLDLAIGTIGWAVMLQVELAAEDWPRLLPVATTGHFTLPDARPGENRASTGARRARLFSQRILQLATHHQVQWIFYEYPDKPRFGSGPLREFRTMQGLGFAEGLLVNLVGELAVNGVQVLAVSTTEAKQAILGRDAGQKATIRKAIENQYGWDLSHTTDDESDAIAVAIAGFRILNRPKRTTRRTTPTPERSSKTNHAPPGRPSPTARRRPFGVPLNQLGSRSRRASAPA